MSLGLCRREYRQRSCGSFRPDLCNRAEPVLPRGTWLASTAGESPPGETGLSHGEAGRGTSRFMSRSMDADKGSTDDRAGSGPRPSLLVRWLGALGLGVIWRNRFARPVLRFGRSPMPRIFLSQKIADVRFRAMACLLRQRTRYRCCSVWDETQAWSFQEYRNRSISRRSGCRG